MASFHFSVKFGGKGKGAKHASYIAREDEYGKKEEDLIHKEHGNMPKWANHDPTIFWQYADLNERKNGSVYKEYEFALPRELSDEQNIEFIREFVKQEIGEDHPYQYAFHKPDAAIEGNEQPHVHLMFCQRKLDGVDRDPDQFFKRYNAKNPERGGCKKENECATYIERKEALVALRERFSDMQNRHLERAGFDERVDHRSLKDRGIDRQPEQKIGWLVTGNEKLKEAVLECREARKALRELDHEIVVTDRISDKVQSPKYDDKRTLEQKEKLAVARAIQDEKNPMEREQGALVIKGVARNQTTKNWDTTIALYEKSDGFSGQIKIDGVMKDVDISVDKNAEYQSKRLVIKAAGTNTVLGHGFVNNGTKEGWKNHFDEVVFRVGNELSAARMLPRASEKARALAGFEHARIPREPMKKNDTRDPGQQVSQDKPIESKNDQRSQEQAERMRLAREAQELAEQQRNDNPRPSRPLRR